MESENVLDAVSKDFNSANDRVISQAKLFVKALGNIYPFIIYCNITQNQYEVLDYSKSHFRRLKNKGSFDEFIAQNLELIPDEKNKTLFQEVFNPQNLISYYKNGEESLSTKFQIVTQDKHWVEANISFLENNGDDVSLLVFIRYIDNEVKKNEEAKHSQAISGLLASEYSCVYYVNLDSDEFLPFHVTDRISNAFGDIFRQRISYTAICHLYADKYILKQDREDFLDFCSINFIKSQLKNKDRFTKIYRNEQNKYCEMKCVKLGDWKLSKTIILGFAIKDKEIRKDIKVQKELEKAKEKAERANEAKSTFLARISHDIRTPINGVIGMTELAMKELNDKKQIKYCLDKISKTSYHLLSLVNDILDIEHIQKDKVEIVNKPMNIYSFIDGCLSITSGSLVNRKLELISDIGQLSHPFVFADELHLRQALVNLIGNAIKFTEDGGKIILRARELSAGDKIVTYSFEVEDNGIGMSKDFLNHVWDLFAQENNDINPESKGTGLGMPIAKFLIEAMGGNITVQSEQGVGSIFTIVVSFVIDEITAAMNKHSVTNSTNNLVGTRILLVEDNEMNQKTSERLLTSEGATVTIAKSGMEAVTAFSESELNSFDAILMDIIMPKMNGFETTKAIRSLNRPDALITPIIATTANGFERDIRQSMEAGMNAHLTKPLEINQLIRTLLKCIRARSMDQAEKLKIAMTQANKDSLTGVNNRTAYDNIESKITNDIVNGKDLKFAILVCDVNNLKITNDTIGHDAGDLLIIDGCKIICNTFKHSPVYRVGGDEFAVLLQKTDYENRLQLLKTFREKMAKEIFISGAVSIASGLSDYEPGKDMCVSDVFKRADIEMYKNKKAMKIMLKNL